MKELPETADSIAQWCKDVFVTKVYFYIFYKRSQNFKPRNPFWFPKSQTATFCSSLIREHFINFISDM